MAAPVKPTPPSPRASRTDPTNFPTRADDTMTYALVTGPDYMELAADYAEVQAEASLAAAVAGNLAALDLVALAGYVIGVNDAGDALEGVELVPPSTATETAEGLVEKATSSEGTTPVSDKFPDTVVVEEMIDERIQFSSSYTSSGQTITNAGSLTLAHGLGAIPALVQMHLKCTTAEFGYSIGDIVYISPGFERSDVGISCVPDTTNLVIKYAADAFVFGVIDKATGVNRFITVGSWDFYARAWA